MKPGASETMTTSSGIMEQLQHSNELSLENIINIALQNSTQTRYAWLQARTAAGSLGASRALYFPTVTASADMDRYKQSLIGSQLSFLLTTYGFSASVNYLLFNFGGRYSQVKEARYALLSADLSQNYTIQNVILQVEQAYYQYLGEKALLKAEQKNLEDAKTNLDAAQERYTAGLATIADVLQSKAAYSQAKLALENVNGQIQIMYGALATSMGFPANIPIAVGNLPEHVPDKEIDDSIDDLIKKAEESRPDLAAARAQVVGAKARVHAILSSGLPSLSLNGTASRTYLYSPPGNPYFDQYSGAVLLEFPLFNGFSTAYNIFAAQQQAKAAQQQLKGTQQQVILQVWNSYYSFKTAQQSLETSEDFLASARQSADAALGMYKQGLGDIISLLNAQNTLALARAQEIQARTTWFLAMAQLAHDTGVLTPGFLNAKASANHDQRRKVQ
ncbi:MAG: TolC family protein [Deltaproteobacteria bacterium]|nr:TolC family protein [Deltaproteobacteria bacterium]